MSHPVPDDPELTTVGPDFAVVHEGLRSRRYDGLTPDAEHEVEGFRFRSLPEPGRLLTTFATVNDLHFGETVAGLVEGADVGPVCSSEPGDEPYPEMMNRSAIDEIQAIDPAFVVVKGDLTSQGTAQEYERFLEVYGGAFGDRLAFVRGNHESYDGSELGAIATQEVVLPGVRLAIIDTSVAARAGGVLRAEQLEWLDALAAASDRPVMVFGHHHPWNPASDERSLGYFGIRPDDSERLVDLVARRLRIVGYFAGHTHRNRVRHFAATGAFPWVEVASVKEFPGSWAEYRVHEDGILQIHHRISTPEALVWSEKTKHMYGGGYHDYAFGRLADRCFAFSGGREVSGRGR